MCYTLQLPTAAAHSPCMDFDNNVDVDVTLDVRYWLCVYFERLKIGLRKEKLHWIKALYYVIYICKIYLDLDTHILKQTITPLVHTCIIFIQEEFSMRV